MFRMSRRHQHQSEIPFVLFQVCLVDRKVSEHHLQVTLSLSLCNIPSCSVSWIGRAAIVTVLKRGNMQQMMMYAIAGTAAANNKNNDGKKDKDE